MRNLVRGEWIFFASTWNEDCAFTRIGIFAGHEGVDEVALVARTSTARGDQVTCCALDAKEEILRRRLLLRIGCLSDANGDGALLESKAD